MAIIAIIITIIIISNVITMTLYLCIGSFYQPTDFQSVWNTFFRDKYFWWTFSLSKNFPNSSLSFIYLFILV